jgi:hypothetical protein
MHKKINLIVNWLDLDRQLMEKEINEDIVELHDDDDDDDDDDQ